MNKIFKIISLILFFGLFVGVYVYFHYDIQPEKVSDVVINENEYNEKLKEMNEPLTSRIDYDKEILFLYMGELNNGVLYENLLTNRLSPTIANFNEETKSIYFYNQDKLPSSTTEMMLLQGVYSMDNLLKEELYSTNEDNLNLDLSTIKYSYDDSTIPLRNEDRLFLDTELSIHKIDNKGTVEVKFGDEVFTLKVMESKEFMKKGFDEKEGLKSKIVITNYGLWETKKMKYEIKN